MKNNTYKTSQIAARCGIHPNTVRLYEELGFLPPVPRAANSYRMYSDLHLEHVRLARTALQSTWLGGTIRQKALAVLRLAASGNYDEALRQAREHLALVIEEREKAEIAAAHLEAWAAGGGNGFTTSTGPRLKINEAAARLGITRDMLRSWERNGLIAVPRHAENGYRVYGETELRRLYVIRALRKARFSLISIHHMFRRYDHGLREGLSSVLDELPPEEEDIVYNTSRWLTKIKNIEEAARELLDRLELLKSLL